MLQDPEKGHVRSLAVCFLVFWWPPYGILKAIIFLSCGFYVLSFFLFPYLISAVADWMSTILLHVVRPSANLECRSEMCCMRLAGPKKIAKNFQSAHHLTTLSSYIFATKACIDNRKNLLNSNMSSRCPHNMVNFGPPLKLQDGLRSAK